MRLILKPKLNSKNKIQAINTWAVALLRYGAGIINWKVDELKIMDRTTRKTLTMYGVLYPKSVIDRLYLKRKHGGRGLISFETCVRSEENNMGLYVRESNEMLLTGLKKVGIVKTEIHMKKKNFKKNSQNEFKNKWHEKRMYGQFVREMPEEIDKDLSWKWLVKSDLKVQTEATIFAAQDQALRTNYTKNKIDKTSENQYHVEDDDVPCSYHVEDDDVKLTWEINIQCDNVMEARRPDLTWWTKRRNHASSSMLLPQVIVG